MRRLAERRLPRAVFDFADGAAEDETTLRRNEAAFDDVRLLPRPLNGAGARDLSIELFGPAPAHAGDRRPDRPRRACSGRTASAAPRAPRRRPARPSA